MGAYRFRAVGKLGAGSFSEVWAGETIGDAWHPAAGQGVAIKDIGCSTEAGFQQALYEVELLDRLRGPEQLRLPCYLAHRVDGPPGGRCRVRVAMTRTPGEPLDAFLRKPLALGQDAPRACQRGCALAIQFLRQLGPTLDRVNRHAWHRDINPRNVILGDHFTGGPLCLGEAGENDPEALARRASFWLIDFGLAVDAPSWPTAWRRGDVAGDCRYWAACSFVQSFYGPDNLETRPDLCNQYRYRLDAVGLALTALEIVCATALATRSSWSDVTFRGSWRRLFVAWEKYHEDVSRWHGEIFQTFTTRADPGPLYKRLAEQDQVAERVAEHHARLRSLLRACTRRAEDVRIQILLGTIADLIDEQSTLSLAEAADRLKRAVRTAAEASSDARGGRAHPVTPPGAAALTGRVAAAVRAAAAAAGLPAPPPQAPQRRSSVPAAAPPRAVPAVIADAFRQEPPSPLGSRGAVAVIAPPAAPCATHDLLPAVGLLWQEDTFPFYPSEKDGAIQISQIALQVALQAAVQAAMKDAKVLAAAADAAARTAPAEVRRKRPSLGGS